MPWIKRYFSFKAFQFTLKELSKIPTASISELSHQSELCAHKVFVISFSGVMKSREQAAWGSARLSQHGVTKHTYCNTKHPLPCVGTNKQHCSPNKTCPRDKTSLAKRGKDGENSDLQTSLTVKLPQFSHTGSQEITV